MPYSNITYKVELTKSDIEFIHRRLKGMTFYEERIKPKIREGVIRNKRNENNKETQDDPQAPRDA